MADIDIGGGITTWRGPVYKYKSLDGRGLEQVKEMIRDRVIYCPRPAILNDDRECRPAIVIGDIKDPAYWSSVERWVRNCLTRREPVPTEEQIQVELRGLTQAALDDMVARMVPEYHAALNDRYRILSFADARDNAHLWDNYAAKFSGVCLEFNFDQFFTTVYRISYHDTLDAMDITDEIGFSNLKTSALIKTTPWRVESECRVIVADPPVSGDEPRIVNDRIYFGGQLTGIVFGERTTRAHIDEILALLDPADHPPLYVARGHIPFRKVAVFELLRPIAKLSPATSPFAPISRVKRSAF